MLVSREKLKRLMRHAFVMMGFMLGMGGMNAWAQDPIPDAVKLDKKYIADDDTGRTGKIVLEVYVTGKITSTQTSIPTDIVCVLDMSQSMVNNTMTLEDPNNHQTYTMTRLQALAISMHGFIQQIYDDAVENNCNHRMSVVTFASEENSKLLTTSPVTSYTDWDATTYRESLVDVVVDGALNPLLGTTLTGSGSNYGDSGWQTGLIYTQRTGTGTQMNTGLDGAAGVLNSRTDAEKLFEAPDGTTMARNMVVVFFTDGYPTTQGNNNSEYFKGDNITIANLATASAAVIKQIEVTDPQETTTIPMVFTIGCTADADPKAAYQSNHGQDGRYYTGTTSFNGLMHFISSDYDKTLTSWSDNIVNEHPANNDYDGYYFGASNADDLQKAFASIASQSGGTPVNLGSSTVVQDVISPSFQLPDGTDVKDIIVYAPKVTNVTGTEGNYVITFADTTTSIVNNAIQFLTMENGVAQANDTKENRIDPDDLIVINDKTLTFTGFDFSAQFCSPIVENGEITGCRGRKLVIVFPIEVAEGIWGDGISTEKMAKNRIF